MENIKTQNESQTKRLVEETKKYREQYEIAEEALNKMKQAEFDIK